VSHATSARVRQEDARARASFGAFVAVLACVFVLGGARVTLVVRAAEAAITESHVQAEIKAQRAEADKLEVDRSSLSTPSRIAGIASASMDMGEPRSVRYISMQDGATVADGAARSAGTAAATQVASTDVMSRLFGAVMDLSAGEAQSLLVGDLGLAGSR
jgi:cell division protein FtsL